MAAHRPDRGDGFRVSDDLILLHFSRPIVAFDDPVTFRNPLFP
jgi:hypothetical protein